MRRRNTGGESKDLVEMRAEREAKQPYAAEIEERELENHDNENPKPVRDNSRGDQRKTRS